ncbi:MAG: RNA methyltransferase substrate-binding domain-containing protein [Bacteroidia bacterium]
MMPEENNEERRSSRPNRGGDRPQGRPNRRDEGRGRPNDRRDNRRPDHDEDKMEGKDFIYGARTVMEAMEAGRQIDKILLKKGLDSELRNDVYELARSQNIPIQVVPVEKLDRLTKGMNHQGVLAFTGVVAYGDLEGIVNGLKEKGVEPLLLMVDQVSDVRNFGGIARTAECLGVHAIVIPEQGSAHQAGTPESECGRAQSRPGMPGAPPARRRLSAPRPGRTPCGLCREGCQSPLGNRP